MSNKIGTYFLSARLAKNLSQNALAKEMGYSSAQLVSNWERGICKPPIRSLKRLIKILELNQNEVLQFYVDERKSEIKALL